MTEKSLRESLTRQLESKGANAEHFSGLINDYIWLWNQMREMKADIKARGRVYTAVSAAGKEYEKDNPSVKYALLYNKQMLQILKDLGLTTDTAVSDDDDPL